MKKTIEGGMEENLNKKKSKKTPKKFSRGVVQVK